VRWDEPAPQEREAQERSWQVVRSAWSTRSRHPRSRRPTVRRLPALALAAALAVVAAALSPPGRAVLGSIKHAVRGEQVKPALFALPDGGRLLVESQFGTWVVQRDGSKRLLRDYRDPAWSPHGIYLAALFGHELRALEPNGTVHWSIARPRPLAFPTWSDATPPCCRIAYLAGRQLRVVNGDGTDDRVVAQPVARVAPAWRPRTHLLAYVTVGGAIRIVDTDTGQRLTGLHDAFPRQLEWSSDGRLLAAREGGVVAIYRPDGSRVTGISTRSLGRGNPFTVLAFRPHSHTLAWSTYDRRSDTSTVRGGPVAGTKRRIFAGSGRITSIAWSGDGRWLALGWPDANQLLFIRSTAVRKIVAVTNLTSSVGARPSLGGWCCS
jgi:hypothetical protein